MKGRSLFIIIIVSVLGFLSAMPLFTANGAWKTDHLTLLYSNNLNGEIDPCPG